MALPTSGPLGIGDIRTELGTSVSSLRSLSDLAGFSPPDNISDFYGYSPVTAVDLAGRITGTRLNNYYFQYNFFNQGASGDYSGLTELYVSLTFNAYDFNQGRVRNVVDEFVVDITDFQTTSNTFRESLLGPANFYFQYMVSINYWATSSSETLNIVSLTT